jgi:hypothetical protein
MDPRLHGASTTVSRRGFVQIAATAAAGVAGATLVRPARTAARSGEDHRQAVVPPKPIPGGVTLPTGAQIHVWPAGDPAVRLPFTHGTLRGFDVDPSTVTDFRGFSAIAYHAGTATGSDGATYNLESHMTVQQGSYVAADGTRRFGTFSFI